MGPILALIAPSPLVNLLIAYISGMKDTTDTARYASYLDLHLIIDSEGHLIVKLYKRQFIISHSSLSIYMKQHSISTLYLHMAYISLGWYNIAGLAFPQQTVAANKKATEPPPFMHHLSAATRGQQQKYMYMHFARYLRHKTSRVAWNGILRSLSVRHVRLLLIASCTRYYIIL